jgi:cell wall assembly regulator SMI1
MQELIARLDALLQQHRPTYYQKLLPGLTSDDLQAFEQYLGFSVPPTFKQLYGWKNGQRTATFESFQLNQTLMNIEQVKKGYRILTDLLDAGEFKEEHWWSPSWLPFLSSGSGDHFCLDLEGTFTGSVGQIIEFWHGDPARNIVAPSLESWLADYVLLLEQEDWEYYRETGDKIFLDWASTASGYPIKQKAG